MPRVKIRAWTYSYWGDQTNSVGRSPCVDRLAVFLVSSRSCSENLVRENGLGRAKPPLPRPTRGSQGWTDVPEEHRSLARRSSLQPTREILVHETSPPLL